MNQIISVFFILFFGHIALANGSGYSCQSFFKEEPLPPVHARLPVDLRALYQEEIQKISSPNEIVRRNKKIQKQIENYIPVQNGKRASELPYSKFLEAYEILERDFTGQKMDQYERADCKVGYCFGRAYLSHMILLKMGLQPDSIRKVWAVGKMNSGEDNIMWEFHVATAVYVTDYGWMVLDTNFGRPMPLREWFSRNLAEDVDGTTRLYVTDARKFALTVGQYSSSELGTKLPREYDFYSHYFVDNTKAIRSTPIDKIQD